MNQAALLIHASSSLPPSTFNIFVLLLVHLSHADDRLSVVLVLTNLSLRRVKFVLAPSSDPLGSVNCPETNPIRGRTVEFGNSRLFHRHRRTKTRRRSALLAVVKRSWKKEEDVIEEETEKHAVAVWEEPGRVDPNVWDRARLVQLLCCCNVRGARGNGPPGRGGTT